MASPPHVTLTQIAAAAGVSVSTASRALRGRGEMAPDDPRASARRRPQPRPLSLGRTTRPATVGDLAAVRPRARPLPRPVHRRGHRRRPYRRRGAELRPRAHRRARDAGRRLADANSLSRLGGRRAGAHPAHIQTARHPAGCRHSRSCSWIRGRTPRSSCRACAPPIAPAASRRPSTSWRRARDDSS